MQQCEELEEDAIVRMMEGLFHDGNIVAKVPTSVEHVIHPVLPCYDYEQVFVVLLQPSTPGFFMTQLHELFTPYERRTTNKYVVLKYIEVLDCIVALVYAIPWPYVCKRTEGFHDHIRTLVKVENGIISSIAPHIDTIKQRARRTMILDQDTKTISLMPADEDLHEWRSAVPENQVVKADMTKFRHIGSYPCLITQGGYYGIFRPSADEVLDAIPNAVYRRVREGEFLYVDVRPNGAKGVPHAQTCIMDRFHVCIVDVFVAK